MLQIIYSSNNFVKQGFSKMILQSSEKFKHLGISLISICDPGFLFTQPVFIKKNCFQLLVPLTIIIVRKIMMHCL